MKNVQTYVQLVFQKNETRHTTTTKTHACKMSKININGSDDMFYRYKMPCINVSVRKNNKTYFINIEEVAKSLNRNSIEILKWLGYNLDSATNHKEYSLNGKHTEDALQKKIQEYIELHVLCDTCKNPETIYKKDKKTKKICKVCKACSASSPIKIHPKLKKNMESKIN